jgi:hypothetical protein
MSAADPKAIESTDAAHGKAERDAVRHDNPGPTAIILAQVDGEESAHVDARTFCDEGLCVYLHTDLGIAVMTPDQARAAAKALTTMADRVASANVTLRGVHDGVGECSPVRIDVCNHRFHGTGKTTTGVYGNQVDTCAICGEGPAHKGHV